MYDNEISSRSRVYDGGEYELSCFLPIYRRHHKVSLLSDIVLCSISNFPLSVSNKTTNITNWWFRSRLRCLFSFQSVLDCVELYLLLHNFKTCANIRNTSARKLWSKILLNKFPFLLASQHHFIIINAPSPFFRSIPVTFFPFLRLFKVFKTMLGFLMPIKRQY